MSEPIRFRCPSCPGHFVDLPTDLSPSPEAYFCPMCGSLLRADRVVITPASPPPAAVPASPTPPASAAPAQGGRPWPRVVVALAAAVLLHVLAGVVFWATSGNKSNTPTEPTAKAPAPFVPNPPAGPVPDRPHRGTPDWEPSPLDQLNRERIPSEERETNPVDRLVAVLGAHHGPYPGESLCLAYSPDGQWLASGHPDNAVRLWDADGRLVATLRTPRKSDWSNEMTVTFAPDSDSVIAAGVGSDGRVWVQTWGLDGNERSRASLPEPRSSAKLTAAADGRILAVTSARQGSSVNSENSQAPEVRIWELGANGPQARAVVPAEGDVRAVAVAPDGQTIAVASENGFRLWGIPPQPARENLWDEARWWLVSVFVLLGTLAAALLIAAAESGGKLGSIAAVVMGVYVVSSLVTIGMAGNGWWLLLAGALGGTPLLVAELALRRARSGGGSGGHAVPWVYAVLTIAGPGVCLAIILWPKAASFPQALPLPLPEGCPQSGVVSVSFTPDGQALAIGFESREVRVIGLGDSVRLDEVPTARQEGKVRHVAAAPNGRRLATATAAGIWIWDATRPGEPRRLLPPEASRFCCDSRLLADGHTLALRGLTGDLQFWDLGGGVVPAPRAPLAIPAAAESPSELYAAWFGGSVWLAPDGKTMAVHGDDGAIRLWDVGRRPPVALGLAAEGDGLTSEQRRSPLIGLLSGRHTDTEPFHRYESAGVIFAPAGRRMLLHRERVKGVHVQRLLAFGGQQPQERLRLEGYRAADFSPDGKVLATADGRGRLRLWDLTADPVAELAGAEGAPPSTRLCFAPDGRALATYGQATVGLWDLRGAAPRLRATIEHGMAVPSVVFSPDGRTLATNEESDQGHFPHAHLWDLTDDLPRARLTLPEERVAGFAFGGAAAVTLGEDRHVRLYGTGDGTKLADWVLPACPDVENDFYRAHDNWTSFDGSHSRDEFKEWAHLADHTLRVTPDGRHLVVTAENATWYVYRLWPDDPPGRALADYDAQLSRDPGRADLRLARAQALLWRGRYDEALADLDQAAAAESPKAYCLRGLVRAARKDQDGAIADFGAVIRLDPQPARAYHRRGLAYAQKGDFARAKADLDEAFDRDPALAQ
jgi:WD40 repeat protein